jgi:hypothetical protein
MDINKNKIATVTPIAVAGILALAVLAIAISSTNRAFAQEKPTELTVSVSPDTFGASSYHVTGKLTSEGQGVGGATITFTWYMSGLGITGKNPAAAILSPTETNADGTYSVTGSITRDSVIAHYAGDNEHSPATSKMIVLKRG